MRTPVQNAQRPFYLASAEDGVDRRAMVSLGPANDKNYCFFDCQFCYVHGPFPKYESATPEEILSWLLQNVGEFDVIYVSGDTDSFAFKRSKEAIRLLRLIGENIEALRAEVLFTTRYVFSDDENEELGRIARTIRQSGRLLIGCVSVCQLHHQELEPAPVPSPYDRIDQLGVWKHLGLATVLAIRPFIPGVSVSDFVQLATHGVRFADVVIGGHLYVDRQGEIEPKLNQAMSGWRSNEHTFVDQPLDFSSTDEVWREVQHTEAEVAVRSVCRQLGKPFHMRSTPAVDHIKKNRDYYVGSNNHRMFSANVLASVAMQISVLERHLSKDGSFWGEPEMGFREFVGSNIKRFDTHPAGATVDDVAADVGLAKIDPKNYHFQCAFKMLQEELQTLFLNSFGDEKISSEPSVKTILYENSEVVGEFFGSVPNGWDALVKMKRNLLSRNRMRSLRAKWFTTLFADVEKNLRDLVCTSISNMGAHPEFRRAIAETLKEYPASAIDPDDGSLLMEMSLDFSNFMAADSEMTFKVARRFFAALQPNKAVRDLQSSQHMRDGLRELGGDRVQIFENLLRLRREALHNADFQDYFPHKQFVKDSTFDEVTDWTNERCSLVVQFLCSICVESALCCVSTLTSEEHGLAAEVAPITKWKANAEIRVHSLTLLELEAYWLAYFFAEASDYFLEDGKSPMLKLNAAFAFQNIANRSSGRFIFTDRAVPGPKSGETWHPKHLLIRKSILRDTTDIHQIMIDASSEMSLFEFRNWPALAFLRGTNEFQQALLEIEKAEASKAFGDG